MQDVKKIFSHQGVDYPLVFNLNVMENIQQEYGSVQAWGDLTDGTAYGKRDYEKKNGVDSWDELTDEQKAANKGEPDAKAIIFGFGEMLNEGIDMENEARFHRGLASGESLRPAMSLRAVGRLITSMGLDIATEKLKETVIESQRMENEETKNV